MPLRPRLVPTADRDDPTWSRIRQEAQDAADREPQLATFMHSGILLHRTLEAAVAQRIAQRLGGRGLPGDLIRLAFEEAFGAAPTLSEALRTDIAAVLDRDPATTRCLEPVLYYKGFHAIQTHRLAHWLWSNGRKDFALMLQSLSSEVFQTDIHPAVPIGRGILLDHATGLIVGATAVIEDNVSLLQGVTLGGTGKEAGDRHPKIRRGVLIGAGAKVLGNIEVGPCARVAAGAVVLQPVPARTTVAGVPAKVVGAAGCPEPSRTMDHMLPGLEL